jgi:hypothetical protein
MSHEPLFDFLIVGLEQFGEDDGNGFEAVDQTVDVDFDDFVGSVFFAQFFIVLLVLDLCLFQQLGRVALFDLSLVACEFFDELRNLLERHGCVEFDDELFNA